MTGIAVVVGVAGVFLLVVYLAGRAQAGHRRTRKDNGGDSGFLGWGADGGSSDGGCGGDGGGGCD